MNQPLSAERLPKSFKTVKGKQMAYHETGNGDPVVFLHGNPSSSYVWRNVILHLSSTHRCIAVDLIGQGDSDKLDDQGPGSYRFVEHREYLNELLDQLDLGDRVTLVVHDWGSALGFDWAMRNADRVAGIAYFEAVVAPMEYSDLAGDVPESMRMMRSPAGEALVMEANMFIEGMVFNQMSILRELTDQEKDEYRRPFPTPEDRRVILSWAREVPLGGEPADVTAIVAEYSEWLSGSDIPKLFIRSDKGSILNGRLEALCRTWPNQSEVTVEGSHFFQEDSPAQLGKALVDWLTN